MANVYCAVRIESLNETDYFSSLKGQSIGQCTDNVCVFSVLPACEFCGSTLRRNGWTTTPSPLSNSSRHRRVSKTAVFWNVTPCSVVQVPTFKTSFLPPLSGLDWWLWVRLKCRHPCTRLPSVTGHFAPDFIQPASLCLLPLTTSYDLPHVKHRTLQPVSGI